MNTQLRPLAAVVLVAFAGAGAGLLFAPYQLAWRGDSEPLKALLFVVWQASVAMAITRPLTRPER